MDVSLGKLEAEREFLARLAKHTLVIEPEEQHGFVGDSGRLYVQKASKTRDPSGGTPMSWGEYMYGQFTRFNNECTWSYRNKLFEIVCPKCTFTALRVDLPETMPEHQSLKVTNARCNGHEIPLASHPSMVKCEYCAISLSGCIRVGSTINLRPHRTFANKLCPHKKLPIRT